MKSITFRLNDNPYQMSYDIDGNLYIIGSAHINFITGLLDMSFGEHSRSFFVKYLLMRGTQLYRANDIEQGDLLLRTAIDIGLTTGEPFADNWFTHLNEARSECLALRACNNDRHTGPVEVR